MMDAARQPFIHNEKDAESPDRTPALTLPFTSVSLPEPISNAYYTLSDFGQKQRRMALSASPQFIVNHSSNVIGAIELCAEAMVFKAAGGNLVAQHNRGKPIHYIIDPPRQILKTVATNARFTFSPSDLLNPRFYRENFASFSDLKKASQRDLAHGRLINRWQARAMCSSLAGMSFATILPHRKDDPDETVAMTQLWHDKPVHYFGTRLSQALYFPEWGNHKAQLAGLGKTLGGACSFLGGYRNVSEGKQYFRNRAHSYAGVLTAMSGLQLMLGVDSEQSWQNFGATNWLRMALVPKSIYNRYVHGDQRAHWYTASVGTFTMENTFAYLIGGAEIDDEGNIVDKVSLRRKASEGAKRKNNAEKPGPKHRYEIIPAPKTHIDPQSTQHEPLHTMAHATEKCA